MLFLFVLFFLSNFSPDKSWRLYHHSGVSLSLLPWHILPPRLYSTAGCLQACNPLHPGSKLFMAFYHVSHKFPSLALTGLQNMALTALMPYLPHSSAPTVLPQDEATHSSEPALHLSVPLFYFFFLYLEYYLLLSARALLLKFNISFTVFCVMELLKHLSDVTSSDTSLQKAPSDPGNPAPDFLFSSHGIWGCFYTPVRVLCSDFKVVMLAFIPIGWILF